jgi:hypothetical protein
MSTTASNTTIQDIKSIPVCRLRLIDARFQETSGRYYDCVNTVICTTPLGAWFIGKRVALRASVLNTLTIMVVRVDDNIKNAVLRILGVMQITPQIFFENNRKISLCFH